MGIFLWQDVPMEWDPAKYVQFGDYRNRPFHDLTARVTAERPRRVVDLGCGPGSLTAVLARRWPDAEVIGVDSSERMLDTARAMTDLPANLFFELADIAAWTPPPGTDVVVSNAALQWVPGHEQLIRGWLELLEPGAWLAIQVPGNFGAPSHALMRELTESAAWRDKLGEVLRHDGAVSVPAEYLGLLLDAGYRADAWETTYLQVLTGERPVLQWVRGTTLLPVLAALNEQDRDQFEREYAELLDKAYPGGPAGTVYPFRRLFVVGQRPAA
jgi:trans-aconitate 2-methyltransferase